MGVACERFGKDDDSRKGEGAWMDAAKPLSEDGSGEDSSLDVRGINSDGATTAGGSIAGGGVGGLSTGSAGSSTAAITGSTAFSAAVGCFAGTETRIGVATGLGLGCATRLSVAAAGLAGKDGCRGAFVGGVVTVAGADRGGFCDAAVSGIGENCVADFGVEEASSEFIGFKEASLLESSCNARDGGAVRLDFSSSRRGALSAGFEKTAFVFFTFLLPGVSAVGSGKCLRPSTMIGEISILSDLSSTTMLVLVVTPQSSKSGRLSSSSPAQSM